MIFGLYKTTFNSLVPPEFEFVFSAQLVRFRRLRKLSSACPFDVDVMMNYNILLNQLMKYNYED